MINVQNTSTGTVEQRPIRLLEKWGLTAKAYRNAHYGAAVRLRRLHYGLGLPTITIATIVGTTIFATLEKSVNLAVRLSVAAISIVAAVLSGLQTFLRFAERAEAHRNAYSGYDGIVREIDLILALYDGNDQRKLSDDMTRIKKRIDELATIAPELSHNDRFVEAKQQSPGVTESTFKPKLIPASPSLAETGGGTAPTISGIPPEPATMLPMTPVAPAPKPSAAVVSNSIGSFTLKPGVELRVGRDGSICQIVIDEPRISGKHATIKFQEGVLLVRDENSNNGTRINANPIPPFIWTEVPPEAVLGFGPFEFMVRLEF